MTVLFTLLVAVFAVLLGTVTVRRRYWLGTGVCVGSTLVLLYLASLAAAADIPVWGLLMAGWVAAGLLAVAAWSLMRERQKARAGKAAR